MSIREVARKAGVGIGTVSRVLNGRASVSAEVQRRVLEVVKELKYSPNIHARRMWKGRANTLCFVLGWGVYGLWVGLSLGLIVTGITLLWVWTVRLEHYRQDPKTLRP